MLLCCQVGGCLVGLSCLAGKAVVVVVVLIAVVAAFLVATATVILFVAL